MKKIYLFAAAATLFAACSSDDLTLNNDQQKAPRLEESTVGFDVYTQKATTRGGWAGPVTTTGLKTIADATTPGFYGFGVFGYYTDNNEYDQRSTPNFFYNQQVKWNGSVWDYAPLKYWPNEYGDNAVSDDNDKVSFFAYAPFVDVVPSSGKLKITDNGEETWGITSMTRNTAQGDPILKYIASFWKERSVDLCWGVADEASATSWDLTQSGTKQDNIDAGKPWLNIQRPANTSQRVKFNFRHALAQLQMNIDADVDIDGRGETNLVANKTRVWVRQVKFNGFALKGALNLNNGDTNSPKWLDYAGQEDIVSEEVIVYDGRKDGKEGVAGSVATNEKVLGLNPTLVQDGIYKPASGTNVYDNEVNLVINGVDENGNTDTGTDYERAGVTNVTVPLFCQNGENKNSAAVDGGVFHVIPTGDALEIEIVYDIETVVENLAQNLSDGATKGSSIENRISKKISFGPNTDDAKLQAGHSYVVNLHLGMNSVKFDAYVTDWITEPKQDIDLPLNVPAIAVGVKGATTYDNTDIVIPYTGEYTFALTGLNGGESVKNEAGKNTINKGDNDGKQVQSAGFISSPSEWAATANNANTTGIAIQTLKAKTNPGTTNQKQIVTWSGKQSSLGAQLTFIQQAHPLYMKITAANEDQKTITLKRYNNLTERDKTGATGNATDWKQKFGWLCGTDGKALSTSTNGNPEATPATNGIAVYRNGSKLNFKQAVAASLNGNEFDFTDTGAPTTTGTPDPNETTATITIGDNLKVGDVIKVVLKTGDAPTETITFTVSE